MLVLCKHGNVLAASPTRVDSHERYSAAGQAAQGQCAQRSGLGCTCMTLPCKLVPQLTPCPGSPTHESARGGQAHVTLPLSGLLRGDTISRREVAVLGTKRATRAAQLLTQVWGLASAERSVSKWFSSTWRAHEGWSAGSARRVACLELGESADC